MDGGNYNLIIIMGVLGKVLPTLTFWTAKQNFPEKWDPKAFYSERICFFLKKNLYWSVIALQWCVSFCGITK